MMMIPTVRFGQLIVKSSRNYGFSEETAKALKIALLERESFAGLVARKENEGQDIVVKTVAQGTSWHGYLGTDIVVEAIDRSDGESKVMRGGVSLATHRDVLVNQPSSEGIQQIADELTRLVITA